MYYQFTPAQTGTYTFSTCNTVRLSSTHCVRMHRLTNLNITRLNLPFLLLNQANFDTKIIVSTTCDAQGLLTCNDDGGGCSGYTSVTPAITLNVSTRYYVILGSWRADTRAGSGTITVTGPPPTRAPTRSPTYVCFLNQGSVYDFRLRVLIFVC